MKTGLRDYLRAPMPCPPWLEHLDLSSVPRAWRWQAAFLAVGYLGRAGEYRAARVLAETLAGLDFEEMSKGSPADVRLKMAKATICREEGRMDEAARWCRATVESAKPLGIVLPFLGMALGPKSALEMALAADAPKLLAKVKRLTNGYFRNLVRFHNRYTGERVCEGLTPREFYLAQSLKRGLRYKEIAERMGIAQGRVHNMVVALYGTLGVGSGAKIGDLVW